MIYMSESILVTVHPGYARNIGYVPDRYGNYDEYLSRLRDAVWSQDSIIFLYRKDEPPFELPENAEVMRDFDRNRGTGVNARKLISRLKDRGVSKVAIGGEFLWHYWFFGGDTDENFRRDYEELSQEEKERFVDKYVRLSKEEGMDPIPILNGLTGKAVEDGCARYIHNGLSSEFHVETIRDLCYPTVAPQQFSIEDLANHDSSIVTAESPIKS